jgi:phage terminase small subunit
MPRQSAEARSGAAWRDGGGTHPQPPKHLSRGAREVWREIVECRPVDFFQPGSLHLLEQLCVATVAARQIAETVEESPDDQAAAGLYLKYMQRCAMHCQKLRLSIQSALRTESGKLDEKEPSVRGRKGKADVLYGGNVMRF